MSVEEYPQDWDQDEQEPEIQQNVNNTYTNSLQKQPSLSYQNKFLQEKTLNNIVVFFTKFNSLIDKIYSNFGKEQNDLKEILYVLYEKLFTQQTKFVMIKKYNDFFLNPLNRTLLNETFELHRKKTVEFNDESHETTLKLFLRSLFSDPLNEIYLLKLKEFLAILKEATIYFNKSKSLDLEKIKISGFKKYQKMLKRKEGKRDAPILKEIVEFFEGKEPINEKMNNESKTFFGRTINIEEKKMRNLKEIFLHYCKGSPKSGINKIELMNIGGFLAFLKDFQITNEYISKPVRIFYI